MYCVAGGVSGAHKQMLEPQSSDSRLLSQCMAVGRSYSSSDWQRGPASTTVNVPSSRPTDSDTLIMKHWLPTSCCRHVLSDGTVILDYRNALYRLVLCMHIKDVYLSVSIMVSNDFFLLNVNIVSCLKWCVLSDLLFTKWWPWQTLCLLFRLSWMSSLQAHTFIHLLQIYVFIYRYQNKQYTTLM